MILRARVVVAFALCAVSSVAAGCAARQTPKEGLSQETAGGWSYVYTLPANVNTLYPDKSWLPAPYASSYPDLAKTIKTYTDQSLSRSGVRGGSSSVTMQPDGRALVVIHGSDGPILDGFAKTHQAFVDANHGVQALNGVNNCKGASGCWDPHPVSGQPWAFFLPFGLPMINTRAVLFLDYPPDDSLTSVDYLDNFTMERWYAVLQSEGIADPYLYESIVDAHPIAAAGSGQTNYMPNATTYFNSPGNSYINPTLVLLTSPATNLAATSIPVMVLGGPSQKSWAAIIGRPVKTLDVGQDTLPGAAKPTSWVASNHPDVTTYQCCPNDQSAGCLDPGYPPAYSLIPDEVIDLEASCIIQTMSLDPTKSPADAKAQCETAWKTNPSQANQHTICVRAKQDYDFTTQGQCKCPAAAEAFCNANANNACPTNIFTCDYNTMCSSTGAPPKAARPRPKGTASARAL